MDNLTEIEQQLKTLANELYKNPRVKRVDMHVETLMGTSVSYTTLGDPDSPMCKAIKSRDIQNALQNDTRLAPSSPEIARPCPRDLPGSLQQWV